MHGRELGADVNVCRRAGLLHDIGKAVDHEVDGPHALIGADLAQEAATIPARIVHAIQAHHFEVEPQTVEAVPGRGGGRHLGGAPGCPAGVASRTTSSAWRRWRTSPWASRASRRPSPSRPGARCGSWSSPSRWTTTRRWRLNRDIVKRIEDTLDYPGQIKVTVIRETRVVDYAK